MKKLHLTQDCPFCGSADLYLTGDGFAAVTCLDCEAQGPPAKTEAVAVKKWEARKVAVN